MTSRALPPVLIAFGVAQLVLGFLLWVTPGFFFEEIGPYGARNDHYMGDIATWQIALGVVALVAAERPSRRTPVLAFALLQYALHALNHLIDIGEADPNVARPGQLRGAAVDRVAARLVVAAGGARAQEVDR